MTDGRTDGQNATKMNQVGYTFTVTCLLAESIRVFDGPMDRPMNRPTDRPMDRLIHRPKDRVADSLFPNNNWEITKSEGGKRNGASANQVFLERNDLNNFWRHERCHDQ